ncbi:hypothetical protein [Marinobacterium aestuariivivens]|uniref:Uncharacterized protein n=1 Tax=Marinobacterium aestuariivivens TaxID=1698799 RepID=A0ABW2AA04_9GAMM
MIRSNFAITRLVLLPYGTLLTLYLLVIGGGGAWLYFQVREVETSLVVDEVLMEIEPLAEKLRQVDAMAFVRRQEPWLISEAQRLFARLPALRNIAVRGPDGGVQLNNGGGRISTGTTSPLPVDARRVHSFAPSGQRLHAESGTLFLIHFDLTPRPTTLVRLEFGFDREMMLAKVNEGLIKIRQAYWALVSWGP